MSNISEKSWGVDDLAAGLSYSVLSFVAMVFYIPCLIVMRKDKELKIHSCIRMMFHLGIADMINLVTQFVTGICVATGWIYQIPTWLKDVSGSGFMSFSWMIYLPMCNVIGFNRFVTICLSGRMKSTLFSEKATTIWLLICWLIGVMWFVNLAVIPGGNFAYVPSFYTFAIDPNLPRYPTIERMGWWNCFINLTMAPMWYIAILMYLRSVRKSVANLPSQMSDEEVRMQEREHRLMKQVGIICLYTLAFDQYWHWVARPLYSVIGFTFAYGLGNILWITQSGVNPLIYLTLNETIKEKVMLLLNKDKVKPISIKPPKQLAAK